MEDTVLDEERENNWKRVTDEANEAGGDVDKYLLHVNRWDAHMEEKIANHGWIFCRSVGL